MQLLLQKFRVFSNVLPPELILDSAYVGVRIDEHGSEVVVVISQEARSSSIQSMLEGNPEIAAALKSENLKLRVVVEPIPAPQAIHAGTPGYGSGLQGFGTLGWFIILDSELVCVSNHHVLCANGDQTPYGTPIFSGYPNTGVRIGALSYFDNLSTASPRLFDFAIAKVEDPALINASFPLCSDGATVPYPRRLGFEADMSFNNSYVTVGARSPTCATGRFRGIASSIVGPYPGNRTYHFVEQLLFDPISSQGDSGSIVLEKSSGRVVGLIFAGTEGLSSLANPLFRKGWSYQGTKAFDDIEIPVFSSATSSIKVAAAPPNLSSSTLPPIFQAGRTVTPRPMSEWLSTLSTITKGPTVVQPFGDWVHMKVEFSPPGSMPGLPWEANAWVHAPTAIAYTF